MILCLVLGNRIVETLPQEVLTKMHAPPKPDYPIIDAEKLATFDAFLLGIPTRYGNFPAQWKVCSLHSVLGVRITSEHNAQTFLDTTGGLWGSGGLYGKYA